MRVLLLLVLHKNGIQTSWIYLKDSKTNERIKYDKIILFHMSLVSLYDTCMIIIVSFIKC